MKQLSVPLLSQDDREKISVGVFQFSLHELTYAPWKAFPYKPAVQFGIAHSGTEIFLKYVVEEKALRRETTTVNGPVWEDSCVEFFLSFDNLGYYNFEFNCIGTPLVAFGSARANRTFLPVPLIKKIICKAENHENASGNFHWELSVTIPIEVFQFHKIDSLKGTIAHANFYKCGDLTPEPHFLCWNHIDSPTPDFHLPEFFGQLHFA